MLRPPLRLIKSIHAAESPGQYPHDGPGEGRVFGHHAEEPLLADLHHLGAAEGIDHGAPGQLVLDDRHLADDAARDRILIDDAAASDPKGAALHDVHPIGDVAFLEEHLASLEDDGWIVADEAQHLRVAPALDNDPLGLIV